MEPDDAWDEYYTQLEERDRAEDRKSDDFRCYGCERNIGRGGYCVTCRDEMNAQIRGNSAVCQTDTNT